MIRIHKCTTSCYYFGLPCNHRSISGVCLKVRNPTKVEAQADKLTDFVCKDHRDKIVVAYEAFKILYETYKRERKRVHEQILLGLGE